MLLAVCPLPLVVFLGHEVESTFPVLFAMLIVAVIAGSVLPIE
jgi:hypothetical protein